MKTSFRLATLFSCFLLTAMHAQDDESFVTGTFRSAQLINAETTEMTPKGGSEFIIRHRFGLISPDSTAYQQFLGLDLAANIRLGFSFPLTERLSVGIGRTKNYKTVDGEIKYLLLRQREDNAMPISAALYANAAIMTDKFPRIAPYSFFADSVTPFSYSFADRLSYNTTLIVSRKFGEKFSLQLSPSFIYHNLAAAGAEHHTFVLTFGGMYRLGFSSSLIMEYSWRTNNRPATNAYPLSIGWEFGTAGHLFQLVVSSSNEIVWQDLHTRDSFDYLKGKFCIGFNIKRYMWRKK